MATLQELIAQQKALEAQIAQVRQVELGDAISKARALVAEFELLPIDVFEIPRTTKAGGKKDKTKPKVAAKYYDPSTGNSWSGRGLAPKWIADKDREQFLIKSEA